MYCRESNIVRIRTQVRRATQSLRKAGLAYKENPCNITQVRRRDRALAYLALRAKLAYVNACHQGCTLETAHKLGEYYQMLHNDWKGHYDSSLKV